MHTMCVVPLLGQFEVKHVHVFTDSLESDALGNDRHATINSIADENLRKQCCWVLRIDKLTNQTTYLSSCFLMC